MTCCTAQQVNGGGSFAGSLSVGASGASGSAGSGGVLDRIARALDVGIHGGDSGANVNASSRSSGSRNAAGSAGGGAQVIDFPVTNPYRPLLKTRVPVAGLNAFPRVNDIVNVGYSVKTFNARGDADEPLPPDTQSLGFLDPGSTLPSGIGLPQQGPSNLQLILGTIASTLPATISAIKKQPYYAPGTGVNYGQPGYALPGVTTGQQPIANVGGQVGAAVGNIGDTFTNIVAQHPYLVLAAGAALVLMFMQPPRRR